MNGFFEQPEKRWPRTIRRALYGRDGEPCATGGRSEHLGGHRWPSRSRRTVWLTGAIACAVWLGASALARAGGGAENVAVVVNADSFASQAVANAFIEFRQVPRINVVWLSLADLPDFEAVDVDVFRQRILLPTLQTLKQRGLAEQIDYLVYSTDIPYAVRVQADVGERKLPQMLTTTASTTGLTYLYSLTGAKNPEYLGLGVNRYNRLAVRSRPQDERPWTEDELALAIESQKHLADKDYAAAVRTLEKLTAARPQAMHLWYNLACALARLARADDAMQALKQSVSTGWTDVAHLQNDDDLTTLHEREDFQQLVASLGKQQLELRPTIGFRGAVGWNANGEPVRPDQGLHYLLSTMLSVTSGRGLSVREAIEHLRRSAAADGTAPAGTIFLMDNDDVRARTRRPLFEITVHRLQAVGVRAEIVRGTLPQGRDDVMGLVAGSASFDWPASKSQILPGAICEHLTSFGGAMQENADQTPLTEFLRNGAALSSGTVTEPYAIAAKFPSPLLHASYAQGCSAAEAFYQSVSGPYQLLIVGDPLCAPWARRPIVHRPELPSPLQGAVQWTPSAEGPADAAISHFELFVDGVRRAACRAGERFEFDSANLPDGPHKFRLVACVADAIQTQGRVIWSSIVDNHGRSVQLKLDDSGSTTLGQTLKLDAEAPRASAIELRYGAQTLERIAGDHGRFAVPTARLGLGPTRLSAVAFFDDNDAPGAVSAPLELRIKTPAPLAATDVPQDVDWKKGVSVAAGERAAKIVDSTLAGSWLQDLGAQSNESIALDAYFDAATDDLYQFQLQSPRRVEIKIDETVIYAGEDAVWKYLPIALQRGPHRLRVAVTGDGPPRLRLRFGGPGTYSVGARHFRTTVAN